MVINTTVRLNDGADWVGVEQKKNWTKDGALGSPYWRATGYESVLT